MSHLKTATSALTAAVLVTGIGLAWAQTEEQAQPTEPMTTTAAPISEQTPADPNAVPPVDSTMQQQTPPADSTTTPLPSSTVDTTTTPAPAATTAAEPSYEPAPAPTVTEFPPATQSC